MRSLGVVGLLALLACNSRSATRSAAAADTAAAPAPAESLVISGARGVQVWFTLARAAQGPGGKPCLERGLEIRQRGIRVPVPLLYTGESPIILNDSTMRAVLWNHCRPIDPYLVDLRSGRPVREPARSAP